MHERPWHREGMRLLAIECASEACSVALFTADETAFAGDLPDPASLALSAADHRVLGRGHAEHLIPMIRNLPDNGRAEWIAVSRGPGSFTGVRIGIAAARALALAWGSELVGYPTLVLVAAQGQQAQDQQANGRQEAIAAMTGGHGEWFVQAFAADGGALGDLASLTPDAAAMLNADLVAGTRAADLVAKRGRGIACALHPDARALPYLPAHWLTRDISPLYGRAPDAKLPGAKPPPDTPAGKALSR